MLQWLALLRSSCIQICLSQLFVLIIGKCLRTSTVSPQAEAGVSSSIRNTGSLLLTFREWLVKQQDMDDPRIWCLSCSDLPRQAESAGPETRWSCISSGLTLGHQYCLFCVGRNNVRPHIGGWCPLGLPVQGHARWIKCHNEKLGC
jgi:hypothetical protein